MKLKVKPSARHNTVVKGKPQASKPANRTTASQIGEKRFDRYSTYNGSRVPVAAICRKVSKAELPAKLDRKDYLLVQDKAGGVLVREVRHDGDFYQRLDEQTYGSVQAINERAPKGLKAEIVPLRELIGRAKAFNRPVSVLSVASKERIGPVFLLNDFGHDHVAGLTVQHGRLTVLNMGHPNQFNKKTEQYVEPQIVKASAAVLEKAKA